MTNDMRSRVLGHIMAALSRGTFPTREPVAWLYGHVAKEGETPTHTINGVDYVGVVAPKIPQVEGFEFRTIRLFSVGFVTLDFLENVDVEYLKSYDSSYKNYIRHGTGDVYYSANHVNGRVDDWGESKIETPGTVMHIENIIWTSHDLVAAGDENGLSAGDVYLASSDCVCIPIYE